MKRWFLLKLLFLLLLVISSCIETRDEFFINPDGTGKVIHEAILGQVDLGLKDQDAGESDEIKARRMVREEVKNAKGVDVWKDISWEMLPDDRIMFKGTAYFKDINKLKFHNAGVHFSFLNQIRLNLTKDTAQLVIKGEDKAQKEEKTGGQKADSGQGGSFEEDPKKLNELKSMLSVVLSALSMERVFHLPGKRISSSNFQIVDEKTMKLLIDGEKMLSIINAYIDSGQYREDQMKTGKNMLINGAADNAEMNKKMFGENTGIRVIYQNGSGDLFDYKTQVDSARLAYPGLLASFGAVETKRVDPSMAGKFYIGGIRIVFESDSDNGIRPFNYDKGLALSVIGHLPQKAVTAKKGKITKAVMADGESLMSDREWDNLINFAQISKDQQTIIFDVNLKIPKTHGKVLKTLEGSIQYLTAGKPKTIDLGIKHFKAGEKGAFYNAAIEKLGTSRWDSEEQQMDLKLEISSDKVKEIKLYDSNNNPVKCSKTRISSADKVAFHLGRKKFPGKGKIELIVYEQLEQFELPFKLENIILPTR